MRKQSKIFWLLGVLLVLIGTWVLVMKAAFLPSPREEALSEEVALETPVAKEETEEAVTVPQEEKSVVPARDPLTMPFTVQAPFARWDNPLFENACEEASLLMVASWLRGTEALTPETAEKEILALADFQEKRFGHAIDTDTADTAVLLQEYYGVQGGVVQTLKTVIDLERLLREHVVIMPANGQKLGNANFTPPGPINHMLVVLAYDMKTEEFITHDPGTKRGALYRYPKDVLFEALRDYPTAPTHVPNTENKKKVIAVPLDAVVEGGILESS